MEQNGTPMGILCASVYPSDHTTLADGTDLPPKTETEEAGEDGTLYVLREYETPLPESARNQDSLSLEIALYKSVYGYYFDGKELYMIPAQRENHTPMTAQVKRSTDDTLYFAGNGSYDGDSVHAEATVSKVTALVTVNSAQGAFDILPEDCWYELLVTDENGNRLPVEECVAQTKDKLSFTLMGTGKLPETLTLRVLTATEGDWDAEKAASEAEAITLNKQN